VVSVSGGGAGFNPQDGLGFLTLTGATPVLDGAHTSGSFTWNFNSGSQTFDFLPQGFQTRLDYTVQVSDGHGGTDTEVVSILITGTNDGPVAVNDTASTDEDHSVNIAPLANDTDAESDPLTITAIDTNGTLPGGVVAISDGGHVTLASGATVTLQSGHLIYDPTTSANLQALTGTQATDDTFGYVVSDGHVTADASVTVHVQGEWETPTFIADGEVDASARKAAPHDHEILNGSGIPSTHFGLAEANDAGIELGLQVIYRQGPTVTTTDNYNDGVLHFTVNTGSESTVNGSQANVANRAAWNFDYSIATGLDGQHTNLSNFTFKMLVDVDPSAATNFHTLEMVASPVANSTGFVWVDDTVNASGAGTLNGHPIAFADDSGNANVAQNSENYGFGTFQNFLTSQYGPANNFAGPAQFDIELQAFDFQGHQIAQNHIAVDVTDLPHFGTVDAEAQFLDPPHQPQMYFGDGNTPTNYRIAQDNAAGFQLDLKEIFRTGNDIAPTSVDADGTAHYTAPAGSQVVDPADGVTIARADRGAWNFNYVVDTGVNGSTNTLDSFDFKIVMTQNGTNTHVFDLNSATHAWVDETSATAFGGDDFNHPASALVQSQVAENSVNLAFLTNAFGPLATAAAAGTHYDVTLEALDHTTHNVLSSVHDAIVLA
jgi:VCBS repeat-containing protein